MMKGKNGLGNTDCQPKASTVTVNHNSAEVYINFGDSVVILTPATAKRMMHNLRTTIEDWESHNGKIKLPPSVKSPPQSAVRRTIKELYKTRKITPKLLGVNTHRKKKPPAG